MKDNWLMYSQKEIIQKEKFFTEHRDVLSTPELTTEATLMIGVQRAQQIQSEPQLGQQKLWFTGIIGLTFSLLFLILLRTYADPDLWGHLRFGLDMIAARSLVRTDPYSYLTTGVLWINHEWLAEVLMAAVWLGGQSAGLIALRVLLLGITLGLIFFHLTRLLHLSLMPSLATLVLTVSGMMTSISVMRPQLFTFFLFAITLVVIYQAEIGRYQWLWLMPVVIALWVNLHGGVLAGGGILAVWSVLYLAQHFRQWRLLAPPLFLSAASLLLNPHGIELITFLLETATVPRPGISDWQPVQIVSVTGALYVVFIVLSVLAIAGSKRSKRWRLLLLFALTAVMPLSAIRHLPLMSIAFAIFIGEHVVDLWDRRVGWRQWTPPQRPWLAGLPLFCALIIPFLAVSIDRGKILIDNSYPYPQAALTVLKEAGVEGNLVTFFDWGEYIIWHAGPEIKVSIDGRRETVYSPDVYQKHLDFWFGTSQWDRLLEEFPADAVLIIQGTRTDDLLRRSLGWQLVFEDDHSVLFVNEQFEGLSAIQRAVVDFVAPEQSNYFP
jgi:hypothetical protein